MEVNGERERIKIAYGSKKDKSTIVTFYEFWTKVKRNIMRLGPRGIPSYFELHGKSNYIYNSG